MVRFDDSPARLARVFLTVALVATTTATTRPTKSFTTTLVSAQKAYDRQEYHAAALLYEVVVRDNPVAMPSRECGGCARQCNGATPIWRTRAATML